MQPVPKPALTALLGLIVVAALTIYMSHQAVTTTFARGATAWPHQARVALQLQGSHGELLLDHLPVAPTSEHYEIWALRRNATRDLTRVSARLELNPKGQAGVRIPGDIHADTAVGVYAMPDDSSRAAAPTVSDHPVAIVYVPRANSSRG